MKLPLHDEKLLAIVGFARGGEKDPEQREVGVSRTGRHTHTGAPRDFSSNKPAGAAAFSRSYRLSIRRLYQRVSENVSASDA